MLLFCKIATRQGQIQKFTQASRACCGPVFALRGFSHRTTIRCSPCLSTYDSSKLSPHCPPARRNRPCTGWQSYEAGTPESRSLQCPLECHLPQSRDQCLKALQIVDLGERRVLGSIFAEKFTQGSPSLFDPVFQYSTLLAGLLFHFSYELLDLVIVSCHSPLQTGRNLLQRTPVCRNESPHHPVASTLGCVKKSDERGAPRVEFRVEAAHRSGHAPVPCCFTARCNDHFRIRIRLEKFPGESCSRSIGDRLQWF